MVVDSDGFDVDGDIGRCNDIDDDGCLGGDVGERNGGNNHSDHFLLVMIAVVMLVMVTIVAGL